MDIEYLDLLARFRRWLSSGGSCGHWEPGAQDYGRAEGHTGLTVAGVPIFADAGAWSRARVAARSGEGSGLILPEGYEPGGPYQVTLPSVSFAGRNGWTMGGAVTYYSAPLFYPEADSAAVETRNCDDCGAAYRADEAPHVCARPAQVDLDAVTTIQKLAAGGLSVEEIARDMGVEIGWRLWSPQDDGLYGVGIGCVLWPLDRPTLAVCVNTGCAQVGAERARCAESDAPNCRVHALKSRERASSLNEDESVLGAVALWGDIVECEDGWLASRAYPLGFEQECWARAYRVCRLGGG